MVTAVTVVMATPEIWAPVEVGSEYPIYFYSRVICTIQTLVGRQWMSEPSTGWPTVMVTGMAKGGWNRVEKRWDWKTILSYWLSVTFQGVCQTLVGYTSLKNWHFATEKMRELEDEWNFLWGMWPNFSWVNSLLVSGSGRWCKKKSQRTFGRNTSWCEFGHFGFFLSGMFWGVQLYSFTGMSSITLLFGIWVGHVRRIVTVRTQYFIWISKTTQENVR